MTFSYHKLKKPESTRGKGVHSLVVEVDEPGPELDLGRRALVLEDHHVLQDDRPVAQLPRDARVVLKFGYIICQLINQRKSFRK